MIKINKTYTNFAKEIYIGELAFFIELKKHGSEEPIDALKEVVNNYSLVIISSCDEYDVFDQVNAVAELCRKIQKVNPLIKVLIYTKGTIKPVGFAGVKNAEIIVKVLGKESDLDYKQRVNDKIFTWLQKQNAKFIFKVRTDDEFDDVNMIVSSLLLKKSLVYLDIQTYNYDATLLKCYIQGYNVFVQFGGEWNLEK